MVSRCSGLSLLVADFEAAGHLDLASLVKASLNRCENRDPEMPECEKSFPSIWIRGWNFANAMARHAATGFSRAAETIIEERLSICQRCPHLVDQHCQLCGCPCIAENQLLNKLALASESCPLGKWK